MIKTSPLAMRLIRSGC